MRGLTQPRDDADLALRRPNRSSTVVRMRILASRILDASCIPEKDNRRHNRRDAVAASTRGPMNPALMHTARCDEVRRARFAIGAVVSGDLNQRSALQAARSSLKKDSRRNSF